MLDYSKRDVKAYFFAIYFIFLEVHDLLQLRLQPWIELFNNV